MKSYNIFIFMMVTFSDIVKEISQPGLKTHPTSHLIIFKYIIKDYLLLKHPYPFHHHNSITSESSSFGCCVFFLGHFCMSFIHKNT